jgi:hypothetical protein
MLSLKNVTRFVHQMLGNLELWLDTIQPEPLEPDWLKNFLKWRSKVTPVTRI